MPLPEQILYSPKVVAVLFDCTYETVLRLCKEGRIPAVNLGTFKCPRWRVPLSFLEKAMWGVARWKFPRFVRRTCRRADQARRAIARAAAEVKRLESLDTWEDEEDEQG
jgi:hypothetical protein